MSRYERYAEILCNDKRYIPPDTAGVIRSDIVSVLSDFFVIDDDKVSVSLSVSREGEIHINVTGTARSIKVVREEDC